jgi:glycosyltransferase involved in cell wall biosynthesis
LTLSHLPDSSTAPVKTESLIVAGIPAFNEERMIAKVILEVQKHVDKIIVCDDGSTDYTAKIAKQMGVEVISHNRNLGYGAALRSLFARVKELNADVFITIDSDGQHDPNEIPKLIEPILENRADIVFGDRFLDGNMNNVPFYRRLGIKIISKFAGIASNRNFRDAQCGFRGYGHNAISKLNLIESGMGASVELIMKAKKQGLKVAEVSISCKYTDLERTSTKNPVRHGSSVLLSIFQLIIEERPLLFLGLPGLISLIAGITFGIWMIQLYVEEHRIVTNVALAAIAFIMIGVFTIFTSITLYAISRHAKRNGTQN